MWGDGLVDAGGAGGPADGALDGARAQVVTADEARAGVHGEAWGGENPLPAPFSLGIRVLVGQGIGQVDGAVTAGQVVLVQASNLVQVFLEVFDQGFGQDGDAVLLALAVADGDGAVVKVQVLNSEAQTFHEAEAAAVEGPGSREAEEQGSRGAEANSPLHPSTPAPLLRKGLVLSGSGHLLLDGQVGEEGLDFGDAHIFRVSLVVEEDEAFDPVDVSLFGAIGVMLAAQRLPHAV